jgi:iron uptake system EfeUOB component EfeO/EfeM
MKVVSLLQPYLQGKDPGVVPLIRQRDAAVDDLLAHLAATPGYDKTGYVEYSVVSKSDRRQLSAAVNALAEAMSKMSVQVSG